MYSICLMNSLVKSKHTYDYIHDDINQVLNLLES